LDIPEHTVDYTPILEACGFLMIVMAISAVAVFLVRRRMSVSDEPLPPGEGGGFSLSDLRRLRDSGQMTAEEYEKTRKMVAAAARRQLDTPDSAKPKDSRAPNPPVSDR
jgi:hypothetical protein